MGVGICAVRRAIFLDRDGVINKAVIREGRPYPPVNWNEFSWVNGIQDVTQKLKEAGYLLFCVTNQPDVGRGLQDRSMIEAFHKYILESLPLEKIYTCYDYSNNNPLRKPKPGMIFELRKKYHLNLEDCWVVGDRWKDIDAGNTAGCQTIFLDYGYDETLKSSPDYVISDLRQLIPLVIKPI